MANSQMKHQNVLKILTNGNTQLICVRVSLLPMQNRYFKAIGVFRHANQGILHITELMMMLTLKQ